MTTTARRLRDLAERDTKHALRLRDGRDLLGWIEDVDDHVVTFLPAPGPLCLDPAALELPIDQIVPESLAYWDADRRAWVDVAG